MRVLFGPEYDCRHTPYPAPSGAYEWWYFDAISEDGNLVVVAIFFLGSPMSPYYRTMVYGWRPDPMDWCGVFVSVHERLDADPFRWRERAYAYNLGCEGDFPADARRIRIGRSAMTFSGDHTWDLHIDEPGLWGGSTEMDLTFESAFVPRVSAPLAEDVLATGERHTWVCAAPHCRVTGAITLPGSVRRKVGFHGSGYHDHNAGIGPFDDIDRWTWFRAHVPGDGGDLQTVVFYERVQGERRTHDLVVFDSHGGAHVCARESHVWPRQMRYMLVPGIVGSGVVSGTIPEERIFVHATPAGGWRRASRSILADGPFYRRQLYTVTLGRERPTRAGDGVMGALSVGETFTPARLCGPIASRAIWTRLRRRRSDQAAS